MKINSADSYWYQWLANTSVDGLLSIMPINNNGNLNPITIYNTYTSHYLFYIMNPYYNTDANNNLTHRFLPNHYSENGFTLSYMVSRLDGNSYNDVIQLIDRSATPDYSGDGTWVIDPHTYYYPEAYYNDYNSYDSYTLVNTKDKLTQLGFNINYQNDRSRSFITSNSNPVIGYQSWGAHAGMDSNYITNTLTFNYLNGAVFNSIESFNGTSMNPAYRMDKQGLISEFITKGGSGGPCTCYEPYLGGNDNSQYFFPAYAMGYGLVDAAYMGIPYLGWRNIVIGDPLTAIAWGTQTLTKNETWSGKNLVTGPITIPMGKRITLQDNSTI